MDNKTSNKKFRRWWHDHKPSKRRLIQVYAALLYNAHLKGFSTGRIYTGKSKYLCVPGLNCYSCPGAVGACPLGSLQNALASSKTSSLAYIFGILILLGLLLGRTICGFLCPMGLIQELLHKIPSPKLKKNRFTRVFSYFKYVILVVLVCLVPLIYAEKLPVPGFCKYICPSGTLLGAVGLLTNKNNSQLFAMLGPLFTWKFCLLVIFLVGSVFIFRFFCRFFCPLGAIYGFFCRLAMIGVRLDKEQCISCGLCVTTCRMDVRHVGDHECIHCGNCIPVCPTKAIHWNGSRYIIPADVATSAGTASSEKRDVGIPDKAQADRFRRRGRILKIGSLSLAGAILLASLWYYNVYDDPASGTPGDTLSAETGDGEKIYGYEVGSFCPDFSLSGLDGDPDISLADSRDSGKLTVINFWATWCTPCVMELPHFDKLAATYGDRITVIAVNADPDTYSDHFLEDHGFGNSAVIFAQDSPQAAQNGQTVMELIGKSDALPVTVIVDRQGQIMYRQVGSLTYEALLAAIAPGLEN